MRRRRGRSRIWKHQHEEVGVGSSIIKEQEHLPSSSSTITHHHHHGDGDGDASWGLGKSQCGVTLALAPRLWRLDDRKSTWQHGCEIRPHYTERGEERGRRKRSAEAASHLRVCPTDCPQGSHCLLLRARRGHILVGEARSEVVKPRHWAGLGLTRGDGDFFAHHDAPRTTHHRETWHHLAAWSGIAIFVVRE